MTPHPGLDRSRRDAGGVFPVPDGYPDRPGVWVRATRTHVTYVLGTVAAALVPLVGFSVWPRADSRPELKAEMDRLEAEIEVRRYCWERQQELVAELALGRVSLEAATDELLEVNRVRPAWLRGVARAFPDEENERTRVARVLVGWVTSETMADPPRHTEVTRRVGAELDRMIARLG